MATKTTQPEDSTDATEVLVPSASTRTVNLGVEPNTFSLTQKPLSFFGKMEVFSVLGNALDKAMSGPDGISLSELLDGPRPVNGQLSASNFQDADAFVRAITKLVQYAPELLLDLYVIVLGVPRGERDYVKDVMEEPEDRGGLSDEDGLGIIETFIDQNWDVMVDFFSVRIQPLIQKVSNKVQGSAPSKPSKRTPQPTAKT